MSIVTIVCEGGALEREGTRGRVNIGDYQRGTPDKEPGLFEDRRRAPYGVPIDKGTDHRDIDRGPRQTTRNGFDKRDRGDADPVDFAQIETILAVTYPRLQIQQGNVFGTSADDLLFARSQIIPLNFRKPDDVHESPKVTVLYHESGLAR